MVSVWISRSLQNPLTVDQSGPSSRAWQKERDRRPADVIGAAIMVAKIATGEISDNLGIKSAAADLGRLGGQA